MAVRVVMVSIGGGGILGRVVGNPRGLPTSLKPKTCKVKKKTKIK